MFIILFILTYISVINNDALVSEMKCNKFNSIRLIIFLHVKGFCLIYRLSLFKNDTVKNVDECLDTCKYTSLPVLLS